MKSIEKKIEKIKKKVIKLDNKKKKVLSKIESRIDRLKETKWELQSVIDIEQMKENEQKHA